MSSDTIGILDSGVGGLSVLREIRVRLPAIRIHYVGDSAWCPYGTKSPELIRERTSRIVSHLESCGAGLVVIACNSATIHAVDWLRSVHRFPFVGMEPGVKPACALTRSGVIGVLATEASIAGEKFVDLVHRTAQGVTVVTRPCPRFVELVEEGILSGPELDDTIDEYLGPILARGADVIVLGCTHYPFLRHAIESRIPPGISVIDTGEAVARRVESLVSAPAGSGDTFIETTASLERLRTLVPLLLPGMPAELGELRLPE